MSIAVSITQDGTVLNTAGKYVDQDIVVGISDSIKKAAATYTPTTTDQTIAAGQYLSGAQTVKGDANLIAENIRSGKSIFGVAGSLTPGITPSGTKQITANGTYDVTEFASAAVTIRNGTHNLHFEAVNPSQVAGLGSYFTVITGDATLANIRANSTLTIFYIADGTVSCTKSGIAGNITPSAYPIYTSVDDAYQVALRYDSGGGKTMKNTSYPINSDESLSSGSGRVHITASGDLRIYSNTTAYPISPGKIIINIFWEDE